MAHSTQLWDPAIALAHADDDPRLLQELLDIWLDQVPEFIQKLRCHTQCRNMQDICDTTHALRGSLQILGAGRAIERTCRLEQMAKSGAADTVRAELQEVIEELTGLQHEIESALRGRTAAADETNPRH